MKVNLQTKVKRNPRLIWREVKGKFFILDADAGQIRKLNETASFIWRQTEKPSSVFNIVKNLIKNYKVSKKNAQQDVLEFVEYYLNNKILLKATSKTKN